MTALIGELTKRLTDRWLADILAPGALWLLVAWLAVRLGHARPFSADTVAGAALDLTRGRPAEVVVWVFVGVGVAVLAALAAGLVGAGVRGLWWGRWRGPFARLAAVLTRWRAQRAERALARAGTTLPAAYRPGLPTWIGDRLRLADVRIAAQYELSLALLWPRLWQHVDADTRVIVQQARARLDLASTMVGWAALYGALAWFWWPAGLIGAGLAVIGWLRGRTAADAFATTAESTVDLHWRGLVEALGHSVGTTLPPEVADAVNDQLHKGATPQPHRDSGPTAATS
jgi:hypothetical protein